MAKINDLKRAIALDGVRCIRSKKDCYLFTDSRAFSSLNIKFGQENRKGIGSVKVQIQLYITPNMYNYIFEGWYDHVDDDVIYKCLTIESKFSPAYLYSINNCKFNGLWHVEEEGDGAAVPVIDSVEAVFDGDLKYNSLPK